MQYSLLVSTGTRHHMVQRHTGKQNKINILFIYTYIWKLHILLRFATPHFVPCLSVISQCYYNMPASHWHRNNWTPSKVMLITYPIMLCMRFVNFKKFHKILRRTYQIKGQYELFCFKWIESDHQVALPAPVYEFLWAFSFIIW